ncbi:MAG: hypothetical protein OXB84_02645 [Halobacteriovoraceae bacterium]|nr:hypothetical protein [Halobacteriovoraceae bacterium]
MKQKIIWIFFITLFLNSCFSGTGGRRNRVNTGEGAHYGGDDNPCDGDLRKCPVPILDESGETPEPNHCIADGSPSVLSDGSQSEETQSYYRHTIIGHGAGHSSNRGRGYLWSSHDHSCVRTCNTRHTTDGEDRQECYRTNNCVKVGWGNISSDSRFKVRIRSFSHPAHNSLDSMGAQCTATVKRYGTLRVTVGLKHPSSSHITSSVILQADTGTCSRAASLTMPSNQGDHELRILSVEWDYTCEFYKAVYNGRDTGGYDPNRQNNCPLAAFGQGGFNGNCWQIELQWSVDHTYDIPTS